ncbi:MAG: hypothetical protein U1E78_10710 [Gammaproteobacteria bacterium]
MTTTRFVAYLILPKKIGKQSLSPNAILEAQKTQVRSFLKNHENSELLETFIEIADHRYHHTWKDLKKAVDFCLENKASLIISEIKSFISDTEFTNTLQPLIEYHTKPHPQFSPELYCCDQPVIHINNFQTLAEHAKQQKKIHGELIKAGLSRTTAKSGNPHASEVITKVNKPKIENAIIFALLLQPIIATYSQKGYSQRKMVAELNQEGFMAPEGGKWVLSQLQKVIDRMKFCESALNLEKRFIQYQNQGLSLDGMVEHLNNHDIPAPKTKQWDQEQVEKVLEKIQEIHTVLSLNELMIGLLPILRRYHIDEITEALFIRELNQAGVVIPEILRSKAA